MSNAAKSRMGCTLIAADEVCGVRSYVAHSVPIGTAWLHGQLHVIGVCCTYRHSFVSASQLRRLRLRLLSCSHCVATFSAPSALYSYLQSPTCSHFVATSSPLGALIVNSGERFVRGEKSKEPIWGCERAYFAYQYRLFRFPFKPISQSKRAYIDFLLHATRSPPLAISLPTAKLGAASYTLFCIAYIIQSESDNNERRRKC